MGASGECEGGLERARTAFVEREWDEAAALLREADASGTLAAADLELLAAATFLGGREDDAIEAWARAHRAHLDDGESVGAVRCGFWIGCSLLLRGRWAPAQGWLGRIQHVIDGAPEAPLAAAYGLLARGLMALLSGDPQAARTHLEVAAGAGREHGDPDVAALGRLGCGQALILGGDIGDGLAMLDEAMVGVSTGEVSPIPAGVIYCAVIEACQELFDLRRATEWTESLRTWCSAQPDLVPFRGQCLVHRTELLRLHGAWAEAAAEAEHASRHLSAPEHPALGGALYQRAELHRLRGEQGSAEAAYRRATDAGHGSQPGLALLRLSQGRVGQAASAIERALSEPAAPAERARLLVARVEICLHAGDVEAATGCLGELRQLCAHLGDPAMLTAVCDGAAAAVSLAAGDAVSALVSARQSWTAWQAVDAPYEAACARVLIARACRAVGDDDTASMELSAARHVFATLGAAPDIARVDAEVSPRAVSGGLTAREVEVLGLVAKGSTNRQIATALTISEKTVARHVSNIFTKLGVSSRAAATAFAYEHGLT
jgi:DNA-binding CsgD family transcriptional regulator/tetratricopeptide (TPR) repeat protein